LAQVFGSHPPVVYVEEEPVVGCEKFGALIQEWVLDGVLPEPEIGGRARQTEAQNRSLLLAE